MAKEITATDILAKTSEILASPKQWNKGSIARRKNGQFAASYKEDDIMSYCLVGAISKACDILNKDGETKGYGPAFSYLSRETNEYWGLSVAGFNDEASTTYRDVINVLNRARIRAWSDEHTAEVVDH